MTQLWPVVAFLAILLVLAHLCAEEGLFAAAGDAMGRASRGSPRRLLVGVFVVASVITAVLSLDATVVLLTPVVFATAYRIGVRAKPHVYACTHLANSASLLLPVSNLTNLLAFTRVEAVLRPVQRRDGAALAGDDRHRVRRAAPDVPHGPRRRHRGRGGRRRGPHRPCSPWSCSG